jgi:signal transduction histidine kinase
MIIGDPDKLARVFGNLLDNGIKFTPTRGQISIKTKVDGGSVMISILDSGPGINEEARERIFDRFYQTDLSRSKKNRGTGLGLPIAREIIRAHGGDIYVDPTPSQKISPDQRSEPGSTFVVKLPIARSEDSTMVNRRDNPPTKS